MFQNQSLGMNGKGSKNWWYRWYPMQTTTSQKTRMLVFTAVLMALQVVCERIFEFETPIGRVHFGFFPIALCAMLFGPFVAGGAAVFGNTIGFFMLNRSMLGFFPGFMLTKFLMGIVFGVLLYQKKKTVLRIGIASAVTALALNLLLDTYWLSLLLASDYLVLLIPRLLRAGVMFPVQIVILYAFWKNAGTQLERMVNRK